MKLSIITINYNNRDGLQRTIDSVICQTWRDFEWIIIDGGSTDGSKELIEKYQDHFAYWCSEPDKGIYNAMNKGIAKANGEYLQFMNSGDSFVDENVIEEFVNTNWTEDIISGNVILDGIIDKIVYNPDEKELDFDYMRYTSIKHQPSYIKRYLFELYGMYDEGLRIVSDWKFFIDALIIHNCSYRHWNRIVACFYTDGISESPEYHQFHMGERAYVLKEYKRIMRSIEKRDMRIQELNKRIQELDLPVMVILRRKIWAKIVKIINRSQ